MSDGVRPGAPTGAPPRPSLPLLETSLITTKDVTDLLPSKPHSTSAAALQPSEVERDAEIAAASAKAATMPTQGASI